MRWEGASDYYGDVALGDGVLDHAVGWDTQRRSDRDGGGLILALEPDGVRSQARVAWEVVGHHVREPGGREAIPTSTRLTGGAGVVQNANISVVVNLASRFVLAVIAVIGSGRLGRFLATIIDRLSDIHVRIGVVNCLMSCQ